MNIWSVLMLAVSSNLDDLGVGFSMGIKRKIPLVMIGLIAGMSALTMAAGLLLGEQIAMFLPKGVTLYLSSIVFAGFGIWFLWQSVKKDHRNEGEIEKKGLGWKSAVVLGFVLGVDSISLGFSGGLAGYPVLLTSILAGITSFSFIYLGSRFGSSLKVFIMKDWADYGAGALLILLALVQLI